MKCYALLMIFNISQSLIKYDALLVIALRYASIVCNKIKRIGTATNTKNIVYILLKFLIHLLIF